MTLLRLQEIDPLSSKYVFLKVSSPKEIVRLLLARQKRVFGQTIAETQPEFTERVLQRNIKLLLKKYDLELVLRGLEYAVLIADHPFSPSFIEQQIIYYVSLKTL